MASEWADFFAEIEARADEILAENPQLPIGLSKTIETLSSKADFNETLLAVYLERDFTKGRLASKIFRRCFQRTEPDQKKGVVERRPDNAAPIPPEERARILENAKKLIEKLRRKSAEKLGKPG